MTDNSTKFYIKIDLNPNITKCYRGTLYRYAPSPEQPDEAVFSCTTHDYGELLKMYEACLLVYNKLYKPDRFNDKDK